MQDYIGRNYADYKIEAVRYLDDNEANEDDANLYTRVFEGRDSYFVQLASDNQTIILRVSVDGGVYSFN
jgi:hypothetical protein